jgi:hypothetical protein
MATQLTGSVEILRIYELLEKTLSPSELANYKIAIDYEGDTDTKMISLDKLRDILVSTGLWNDRGGYDASTNLFPSTGGSGISNSILRANVYYVTVAGTLGATPVTPGMLLFAKTDIPGQTSGNWLIIGGGGGSFDMPGAIHGATNKTTPVDADEFGIWNSVDGLLNRLSWANLKATLKAYFETGLNFAATGLKIIGSSTGLTTLTTANTSATDYTATFPARNITVAGVDDFGLGNDGEIARSGTTGILYDANLVYDATEIELGVGKANHAAKGRILFSDYGTNTAPALIDLAGNLNGDSSVNPTFYAGFNIKGLNWQRFTTSEPAFFWGLEHNYKSSVTYCECYFQFMSTSGFVGASYVRPFFAVINKTTGIVSRTSLTGGSDGLILGIHDNTGTDEEKVIGKTVVYIKGKHVMIGSLVAALPAWTGRIVTMSDGDNAGLLLELCTAAAEGNWGTAGVLSFNAFANTSAATKRVAQIYALKAGSTANNRGGDLIFMTKPDAGGGSSDVLERMRIHSTGNQSIPTAKYLFKAASQTADTIGDTRTSNQSGWEYLETCTVANSAKGGGTWIITSAKRTVSLVDSNGSEGAGSYVDLVASKSGFGRIIIGDAQEYSDFVFKVDGTVTLINNSTNVVTTSTDAKLVIRDAGSNVRIVNELGSTLIATIVINYNA